MSKKSVKVSRKDDPAVRAIVDRVFDQETAEFVIESLVHQLAVARMNLIIPGPSNVCKMADATVAAAHKRMKKLLADVEALRPYMRSSR